MNGGVSQMDTFDYKPELDRRHGQPFDPGSSRRGPDERAGQPDEVPVRVPAAWRIGRWVSSVFPEIATCVDDLAFLHGALVQDERARAGQLHDELRVPDAGLPLPGGVALVRAGVAGPTTCRPSSSCPTRRGLPYNAKGNFTAGFLPQSHQGTILDAGAPRPIPDLFPPESAAVPHGREPSAKAWTSSAWLNRRHAAANEGDTRLESRIAAYELAAGCSKCPGGPRPRRRDARRRGALYGLDDPVTADFGRRCLMARRLLERGVRFVQVWSGAGGATNNWDNHGDIPKRAAGHRPDGRPPDRGVAARPQGPRPAGRHPGRLEHRVRPDAVHPGRHRPRPQRRDIGRLARRGGHQGGVSAYGESDPWSWKAATGQTYCYDLHATILHLMGIDHTRLTFRHNGIDRRITDVHGHVVEAILT